MVTVKVCGITSVSDALGCIDAGVDAIGLNFHRESPRYCDPEAAREIVDAVAGRMLTVGVVVDEEEESLRVLKQKSGVRCLQLHGDESPELLESLLPHAYKALRVRDSTITREAGRYGGEYLLVDAFVPGQVGGSGARFDWELVRDLARTRKLALAGGLTADNVAEAVRRVDPFCVDVASGVEREPGHKDLDEVRRFVRNAKGLKTPRE